MELYTLTLDESLRSGIKPDSRVPNGAQFLDVCSGLRPTPFGLKDYITINQPFTDDYLTTTLGGSLGWPFPQLFRGKKVTLLCFSDEIFVVDETTWTATPLTFYDAADFGNTSPGTDTITAGGPWHFMDFHDTWVLFNGVSTVFKTAYYSVPVVLNDVTIATGADMKHGRAYMGGFNPSNFYSLADWPSYWKGLLDSCPSEIRQIAETMSGGAGSNWVWWSTIGGGDLLWLISRDLYTGDTRPIHEQITNGTFTGNANSWSFSGSGWAYDTGQNRLVGTATSGTAFQTGANMRTPVYAGMSYTVTYTVSNRSGGTTRIAIGAANGTIRSADGTYTETITALADSASIGITGDNFTGNVDTVSVKLVPTDAYSGTNSPIREIMQRNEFGLAPMPWQGNVLHQRQLGDVMMVYGDGGITALVPGGPVATHGIRDPQGIGRTVGIASRSAVGGNIDNHVFVDAGGELWRMGPNLQAERLGYGHVLSGLLDEHIIVSHDQQRNEFYISGSDSNVKCYVLTQSGFGKAPWCPTQVSFCEGGLVSILLGDTNNTVSVTTNKFGGKRRKQIDQITTVTLTSVDTNTTGWTVVVEYRFQKSKAFAQSAPVVTDSRGVARMNVSGLEFRLVLTHPNRTQVDLDGIEVEMARAGRRNLAIMAP